MTSLMMFKQWEDISTKQSSISKQLLTNITVNQLIILCEVLK